MIKLIADLKSIENITKYQVDGLIVSDDKFSTYNDHIFSFSEIKEVVKYCRENNILSILNIDKIIEEEELDPLYKVIDEYLKLEIDYYIYGDFAVLSYFKEKDITNKLIYDPKTLITNYQEARIHHNLGSLVVVSNELNLEEISDISAIGNSIIEVYGYHQMFYSKRPLLSTYSTFLNKEINLDNKLLHIKEEIREDRYPIYQSIHGTFVYTSYRYTMFKELLDLEDTLKIARISSMFIDEGEIIKVISIYKELLTNKINPDTGYNKLVEVNSNIKSGFIYNKSILKKEKEL